MPGELTLEEKLAMTASALKNVQTQLFELELHYLANTSSLENNPALKKQQADREDALKKAIARLELKHQALTAEQSNPSNR